MPTKQSVRVTKSKNKKQARVSLSFEFDVDDPRAQNIWHGIGLCLWEAMTEDERSEFMRRLEIERAKLEGRPYARGVRRNAAAVRRPPAHFAERAVDELGKRRPTPRTLAQLWVGALEIHGGALADLFRDALASDLGVFSLNVTP